MMDIAHYQDEPLGTQGWLVYDGGPYRLSAGGCRVQPGLTPATLARLASAMTFKQRVLRTNVGGAKCGLDLAPGSPHKREVLQRFIRFLRAELLTRFSMGCDMGTTFSELELLAAPERIPSIKYAIKAAQGLPEHDFFERLRVLDAPVGMLTVGERRAGHALAHAALSVARHQGWPSPLSCTVQGFGNLGRGAVHALMEAGVRIVAVADEHGCVRAPSGLDAAAMLAGPAGAPVRRLSPGAARLPRESLFDVPADLVVLAAGSDAISPEQAGGLPTAAVVVGANCGLSPAAEAVLTGRGLLVVPDFVGGIGGSASMEVLFGRPRRPEPAHVLDLLAVLMHELIGDLLDQMRWRGITLGAAATELAGTVEAAPDERPYGRCPYLTGAGLRYGLAGALTSP